MFYRNKDNKLKITTTEWRWLMIGSLVVIASFVWDYFKYKTSGAATANTSLLNDLANYVPQEFNWPLFWFGQGIIFFTIYKVEIIFSLQTNDNRIQNAQNG